MTTPKAARSASTILVSVRLSDGEERAALANARTLGCTRSDLVRFAVRCGCLLADAPLRASALRAAQRADAPRTRTLGARIDSGLHGSLRDRARDLGVALPPLLRALVVAPIAVDESAQGAIEVLRVKEARTELVGLRREALRIGQNCNQIAHAMNVCKNKNWLPAAHAESIFGNAGSALERMSAQLDEVKERADEGVWLLRDVGAGCGVVPLPPRPGKR